MGQVSDRKQLRLNSGFTDDGYVVLRGIPVHIVMTIYHKNKVNQSVGYECLYKPPPMTPGVPRKRNGKDAVYLGVREVIKDAQGHLAVLL